MICGDCEFAAFKKDGSPCHQCRGTGSLCAECGESCEAGLNVCWTCYAARCMASAPVVWGLAMTRNLAAARNYNRYSPFTRMLEDVLQRRCARGLARRGWRSWRAPFREYIARQGRPANGGLFSRPEIRRQTIAIGKPYSRPLEAGR